MLLYSIYIYIYIAFISREETREIGEAGNKKIRIKRGNRKRKKNRERQIKKEEEERSRKKERERQIKKKKKKIERNN